MTRYYKEKQIIPEVNKKGNVIGKIEKWEAHRKAILHRGFSIALIYKDKYILQHRRHPAFDGTYDLTTSSHQLYVDGKFETLADAAIKAVKREWNNVELIGDPKNLGEIYYRAKDPKSIYMEHEVCDMLAVKVKEIPELNFEFAYGFSLTTKEELTNRKSRIWKLFSPWTKKAIDERII